MAPPTTDSRRETLIGIALVNVATLAWATNMLLGRYLRTDIGPITLAAARVGPAHLLGGALIISGGLWAARSAPARVRTRS